MPSSVIVLAALPVPSDLIFTASLSGPKSKMSPATKVTAELPSEDEPAAGLLRAVSYTHLRAHET